MTYHSIAHPQQHRSSQVRSRLRPEELPAKLRDDSILECVLEIRFKTVEIDELVIGRLVEWATAKFPGSESKRTGAASIPAPLRDATKGLEFAPLIEIDSTASTGANRKIRIGTRVFSHILTGKYCGWEIWSAELDEAIEQFFARAKPTSIQRVGLRYTNALTAERHYVEGLSSLRVGLTVCDEQVGDGTTVAYTQRFGQDHEALVRVATRGFLAPQAPPETTVLVDIDIRTPDGETFTGQNVQTVKQWVVDAHTFEKIEYFSLFPRDLLERLKA